MMLGGGMLGFGLLLMLLFIGLPLLLIVGGIAVAMALLGRRNVSVMSLLGSSTPAGPMASVARYCPHCGQGLQADWTHCPQCGAPVAAQ